MAACQVCISGISVFTLEHPTAANSNNFSADESSTFDKSTWQLESIYQILGLMEWSGKQLGKKRRRKRGRPQK